MTVDPMISYAGAVSHPLWVRGLKSFTNIDLLMTSLVASFMGAWIEIRKSRSTRHAFRVASFMGAWIEIQKYDVDWEVLAVASFMGAWIEILDNVGSNLEPKSHPLWVRGLK